MKTIQDINSLEQKYSDCFKVEGLTVQYTSNGYWTHHIFNEPIYHSQSVKFKIKVTKTENRLIMIGIVDFTKQKDQRHSHNSGNAMCYYGYNGRKYPLGIQEGDGFK